MKHIEYLLSERRDKGKIDVVLGAQWGDEGKGKLVDILSSKYDICARVAGGSNAGHTIVVEVFIVSLNERMFSILVLLIVGKEIQIPLGSIRDIESQSSMCSWKWFSSSSSRTIK